MRVNGDKFNAEETPKPVRTVPGASVEYPDEEESGTILIWQRRPDAVK